MQDVTIACKQAPTPKPVARIFKINSNKPPVLCVGEEIR